MGEVDRTAGVTGVEGEGGREAKQVYIAGLEFSFSSVYLHVDQPSHIANYCLE